MPDTKDIKMQKQRFLPTKAHDQKGRWTDRQKEAFTLILQSSVANGTRGVDRVS